MLLVEDAAPLAALGQSRLARLGYAVVARSGNALGIRWIPLPGHSLEAGAQTGLTSKVEAAQRSLARGNRTAARNQLNAFINREHIRRCIDSAHTPVSALIPAATEPPSLSSRCQCGTVPFLEPASARA